MLRAAGTATQVAAAAFPLLAPDGSAAAPSYSFASAPATGMYRNAGTLTWTINGFVMSINNGGNLSIGSLDLGYSADVYLVRDAASVLAQRNGINPQTFRLYNTFTDASNYERFAVSWASNVATVGPAAAGTGTQRAAVYLTSAPTANAAGTYTVAAGDNTIRNSVAATLTLPAVASSTGRRLRVVTLGANAIISNASNVVPITGGAAGTAILAATAGKWADLECDGTNWIITAAN